MKRVLISGAAGFLGVHLIEELAKELEVIGVDLAERPAQVGARWRRVEDDVDALAEAVGDVAPDLLVHAAFINKKPSDWSDEHYLSSQLSTNIRLFARCAELGLPVVLVSSSAVYGAGDGAERLDETTPRRPVSLYGVAKTLQEMLGEQAATAGLEMLTVRLFNLVGPGQGLGMLVPDWVRQISAIADGAEPVLSVKNRETSRDLLDVRDAARAVAMTVRSFEAGEVFNVASGRAVSLRELSAYLEELCPVPYETVESEPAAGSADARIQCGDATKIRKIHGWTPEFDWRTSVRDFWERYRAQIH